MQLDKIKKKSTIIVALSGGPDSVYLLHELKKIEKKLHLTLVAAHLNHGTREASDKDEKFCKQLCAKLNVTFESKKVELKGVKNFEETARTARYAFLAEMKKKHKANFIATAHHLNDSIETILLNLTRGCSLQGLTGIKDRDDIIRPLAHMKKEEILKSLKAGKIKFIVDQTNSENTFARNKIRNLITPVLKQINPNLEKTFTKNIEHFTKIEDFLNSLAKDWLKKNKDFKITEFKKLNEVLQEKILTYIYKEYTGGTTGLTSKQIENALTIILKNKNLRGTLNKVKFETAYGMCTFLSPDEPKSPPRRGLKNSDTSKITILLDADKLDPNFDPANITIRTWLPGDKLQPLGMKKGTKKLQDFFTDKKIPRAARSKIPILLYKKEIIAVGDLTVGEKFKKTENTKKVLEINLARE